MQRQKAVVLLSGGLDSATVLAIASKTFACYSLSFDYGQRASAELNAAQKLALQMQVQEHRIAAIDLRAFGGSALTDERIAVPSFDVHQASSVKGAAKSALQGNIPITYVPARNTIFLSYALAWAEVLDAQAIFIGVNAVDYSGYPDCRPQYIDAFQRMANLATKQAVQGKEIKIHTPLIHLSKAQIITQGAALGVDYSATVSCYSADEHGFACGKCDSCVLRKQGFNQAGVADSTNYW